MQCRSCLLDKQAEDFYFSNKTRCKECIKASVHRSRMEKLDYYRSFDRQRSSRPDRVAAREAYAQTIEGRLAHARANGKWQVSNAMRRRASQMVNNAIRDGKLERQPCFICGDEKSHAHHAHYDLPLVVTWLCPKHHKEAHRATAVILYEAGEKETLHF